LAGDLQDGSPVTAGQLLVRIDDRRYVQQLAQANARLEADQAQLQQADVKEANLRRLLSISEQEVKVNRDEERRLAGLFESQAASKKEYDFAHLAYQRSLRENTGYQNQIDLIEPERKQLRASIQGRLAEIEVARLDVEYCRIVAPFDGQIDELLVEVGERVQPGSPVATVIDPWRIEVPVELPASAYPQVISGAPVELRAESMPHLRWSGRVERKSPDADEQSRTFRAYVEVDNRQQPTPMVAGYFLSATVTGPTLENALLIPRGAIVGDHVFVVHRAATASERAEAHQRKVDVERFVGERALVKGELQPGDAVIVTNLDRIAQNTVVRLDDPGQAAGEDLARGSS
jgi:RND family efflux transporter MFP subunit